MTDQEHLERAYRRRLAWYPREFRDGNGPEILAVLMAGARDGQRRPGLAGSADLIRGGLWMRLRPSAPRSAPAVQAAVWLMCAGAAITAVNLIIALAYILAGTGGLKAALRKEHPGLTAAQISQQYTHAVTVVIVYLLVVIALWLWMARATGQGGDWARNLSTQLFVLLTLNLTRGFGMPGIHVGFGPGGLTGWLPWLAGLAAVCLLWLPASTAFFRPGWPGSAEALHQARMAELARLRSSRAQLPRQV